MKRRFDRLPIASKLRLIIAGACGIVIIVTGVALMISEWIIIRDRLVVAVQARAAILSANAVAAVTFRSPSDAEEVLRSVQADQGTLAAAIFDGDGTEFARFHAIPHTPPIAAPTQALAYHLFTSRDLTVWMPMYPASGGRPVGTLALRSSLAVLYNRMAIFGAVTIGVIIGAAILALLLSHFLHRFFSEPVAALARAAEQVTGTRDYSVRVEKRTDDELGQLAAAFNVMLSVVQSSHAETNRLYDEVRSHALQLETRVAERTAELQRAYRELESFSYSVSHDLRSPLRSITGFTEAILEDGQSSLGPDSLQHARRILGGAARMNRLIDALLDFSRVSKRELHLATIDIYSMTLEVVAELKAYYHERTIIVSVEPIRACVGDPTLIRQVLMNILGNAFKYSRDRNPAVISVSEEPITHPNECTYLVRDNGAGFEMRHASRLFQVFERLHGAHEFEGTGIGLATAKRIIERHGGRIWAEAELGRGAAFFITLPVAPTAISAGIDTDV